MAAINNLNDEKWSADVLEWVATQRLGLIASQPPGGALLYLTPA
jgi:hypothetical protein